MNRLSARAVDFIAASNFSIARARSRLKAARGPVLKGVGFLPLQMEGRYGFLEVGFGSRVFALRRSHNRLGALDVACEPEPVLAGADNRERRSVRPWIPSFEKLTGDARVERE